MKYIVGFIAWASLLLGDTGCRKFVQAPLPTTELVGASVYNTNQTAASAVSGILSTMENNCIGGGANGISALVGLSADDFALYPGANSLLQEMYVNAQLSSNPSTIWSNLYNVIYQANSAILGITSSTGVTSSMKLQLVGEAECIRAFCYFYLVNLYGDVPLVLTTNYRESEGMGRTATVEVYGQIKADLIAAEGALSQNYLTPAGATTSERVRPNAGAAAALLARVYLYNGKYDSAEMEATNVINNSNYSLVMDLDSAFLVSNTEAIWQLEAPNGGFDAPDGGAFLLSAFGGPSAFFPYILSDSLEYHFEPGDLRQVHWTDSIVVNGTVYYYPFKYKYYYTGNPPAEYSTLIRLAEVYLIRAEARTQQGNLTGPIGALADLNTVRWRAGLGGSTAISQADMLSAIMRERRFELFTEYGHRWMDLKRTATVDAVMQTATSLKGGTWAPTDSLYPIPLDDISGDTKMTQNPGYN
jgi:hypothetical protein